MQTRNNPDPYRNIRKLFVWALLPTVLYMIYMAVTGGELPSAYRGPSSNVPITWVDTPIRFIISGISVYGTLAFFMMIVYGLIQIVVSVFDGGRK